MNENCMQKKHKLTEIQILFRFVGQEKKNCTHKLCLITWLI